MRRTLDEAAAEIVRRLREWFAPVAIYRFGSTADGAPTPDSDVDVLVVVAASNDDFFTRCAAAREALRGIGVPVDVQVYTRDEFESRAVLPVSFERTVKTKGRLVYAA